MFYKSHISNTFSLEKCLEPPHDQHYSPSNYYDKTGFKKIMERFVKEEQYYADSLIVRHHKQHYSGRMPLWAMVELMSFSNISMLYNAMYDSSKDLISKPLGIGRKTLSNHLHCLSVLRNKCAHAARLINTRCNPPAKLSANFLRKNPSVSNDSVFAYILVLKRRLPTEELKISFTQDIIKLIESYNDIIDLALLGFPQNYKSVL